MYRYIDFHALLFILEAYRSGTDRAKIIRRGISVRDLFCGAVGIGRKKHQTGRVKAIADGVFRFLRHGQYRQRTERDLFRDLDFLRPDRHRECDRFAAVGNRHRGCACFGEITRGRPTGGDRGGSAVRVIGAQLHTRGVERFADHIIRFVRQLDEIERTNLLFMKLVGK